MFKIPAKSSRCSDSQEKKRIRKVNEKRHKNKNNSSNFYETPTLKIYFGYTAYIHMFVISLDYGAWKKSEL